MTNHSALLMSLFVVLTYMIGYTIWGADPPRIVFGSMLIGALATIIFILTGPAIDAFKRGVRDGGDNILISQWGIFTLLFLYFGWIQFSTWYRISYGDDGGVYLRNLPVNGLFTTFFFLVAGYTILAPINTGPEIERPSMTRWLIGVAIGSAMAAILGTLSFLGIIDYFNASV